MNILKEADKLTSGDRQADYGHPSEDFTRTAALWSAYKGVEFTVKDVPMMMILLKVSRERNKHKRDNLVDIAGFARTLEMVEK